MGRDLTRPFSEEEIPGLIDKAIRVFLCRETSVHAQHLAEMIEWQFNYSIEEGCILPKSEYRLIRKKKRGKSIQEGNVVYLNFGKV